MNDLSRIQKELGKALTEIEAAWAAVEAARIAALKAAEAAFEMAKLVRDNWKREDGDAICDFAVRCREISVHARSRATLPMETSVCDEFVKRLIQNEAKVQCLGHQPE